MKNIKPNEPCGKNCGERQKLLLTVEDVAGLTDLLVEFWLFVAENERDWDIERFFYAAGRWRITPYYLDAYLRENLGFYYGVYEDIQSSQHQSYDRIHGSGGTISEINSSVQ